jgi:hypothetical protein
MRIFFRTFIVGIILLLTLSACWSYAREADLDELARAKGPAAISLLDKPTLYRETELTALPCSAGDFDFLLDRPRSSIALAGKLHKSLDKYTLEVKRPGLYHIDDGSRLVGDMELALARPGKRVYYVSGYWKIVLGVKLQGRMALFVQYTDRGRAKDRALDVKVRGFMLVDNSVAGAAFKALAFLFPKKVDARIERFATAVRKVVYTVHDNPGEAMKRLEEVPLVPPGEVREFRERFLARAPSLGARYIPTAAPSPRPASSAPARPRGQAREASSPGSARITGWTETAAELSPGPGA